MNWNRVFIFSGILILGANFAAFPFGFIQGSYISHGNPAPAWIPFATAMSVQSASIIIFLVLAIKQANNSWIHAITVAVLTWLISFPLNVLVFHVAFLSWIYSGVYILITCYIGTATGVLIRNKIQNKSMNK